MTSPHSSPHDLLPNERTVLDDRLMDAIVATHLGENREKTRARVELVLESLDQPAAPLGRLRLMSLGVAASLLIAVCVFALTLFGPQETAYAGFDAMLNQLQQQDQTFSIEVEHRGPRTHDLRQRLVRRMRRLRPIPGDRLEAAKLYVRENQYVLVPGRKRAIRGFDGQSQWHIGTLPPPTILQKRDAIDELMTQVRLDVYELLQEVPALWNLEAPRLVDDPAFEKPLVHYVATRNDVPLAQPKRIEIWADPVTGQIQEMHCLALRLPKGELDLCLTLVDTAPLPENWFTREAHQ